LTSSGSVLASSGSVLTSGTVHLTSGSYDRLVLKPLAKRKDE